MKNNFLLFRKIILISLLFFLTTFSYSSGKKDSINEHSHAEVSNYNTEWLEFYYHIAPFGDEISPVEFKNALLAVCGNVETRVITSDKLSDSIYWSELNEPLSIDKAIKIAVKVAGLEDFALTYSEQKAKARTSFCKLNNYPVNELCYLACAYDSGLINKDITLHSPTQLITSLIMGVACVTGNGPIYLGYSSDSDILAKLTERFNNIQLFTNKELNELGANLVMQKVITGFNLKKSSIKSRFLPSLTLSYGHSSELHAKQLIALLNSENIKARIQVIPKTSVYEYLLEWGDPAPASDVYRVEKINDSLYLAFASEYDLELEFCTIDELKEFDSILSKYAKKNSTNQVENSDVKLIYGAWWQPLYSASFNPDADLYSPVIDNVLFTADNEFSLSTFSTVEQSPNIAQKMNEYLANLATVDNVNTQDTRNLSVKCVPRFVNNAFYRYLTGSSSE